MCLDYRRVGSLLFKDTLCISLGAGCSRWKCYTVLVVIQRGKNNFLHPLSCALTGVVGLFSSVWGPLHVKVMSTKCPNMETSGAVKPSIPPISCRCTCVAGYLRRKTNQTRVSAVSTCSQAVVSERSHSFLLLTVAYQGTRACLMFGWHGAVRWRGASPLAARRCQIG